MATISEVRPGDILLFRGRGLIPWAIRLFDGGEVNHAAIALDATDLAEAAGAGLRRNTLAEAAENNVFTEIRRFEGADLTPVLSKASRFVEEGHRYAYQQILLLALLAVTRRIPAPRVAKRLIRSALDHAASALGDMLPSGASWMICSEFVYRCFNEATPPSTISVDLATVFALDEQGGGTFLDWGLQQDDREVELPLLATFGGGFDPLAAEAELEQRIVEYADAANLAGTLPEDAASSLAFTLPVAPPPEPGDEELLTAMASFGVAIQQAREGGAPAPTFGVGLGTVGSVALKGALKGIADVSVDANFVTPRDLAKSASIVTIGRITST
jgi:hypothetical protein